jgi:hypothetical protein
MYLDELVGADIHVTTKPHGTARSSPIRPTASGGFIRFEWKVCGFGERSLIASESRAEPISDRLPPNSRFAHSWQ